MGTPEIPYLDTLALQYRILPAIPLFSTVQSARKRLNQVRQGSLRDYPEMTSDADAIESYARMLRDNSITLGRALVLAADAARFSRAHDQETKLSEAMQSLSTLLNLTGNPVESQTAVGDLFDSTYPQQRSATGFGSRLSSDGRRVEEIDWEKWTADVWDIAANLPQLSSPPVIEAWSEWKVRFRSFLAPNGTSHFLPTISDLRNLVAQKRPATVLKCRLREMTVGAWSEIFVDANSFGETPSWIVPPALIGLGFGREIAHACAGLADLTQPSDIQLVLREYLGQVLQRPTESRSACFFILQAETQSISRGWFPSGNVPSLSLTDSRWSQFLKTTAGTFDLSGLHPSAILIEAVGTDDQIQRQIESGVPSVARTLLELTGASDLRWLVSRGSERGYVAKERTIVAGGDLPSTHKAWAT